jgi:hypothetical protein
MNGESDVSYRKLFGSIRVVPLQEFFSKYMRYIQDHLYNIHFLF